MDVDVSLTDISISLSFCLPLSLKSMKKNTHTLKMYGVIYVPGAGMLKLLPSLDLLIGK